MERDQQIIRTSIVGIVANVLLAGFRAAVGLHTPSTTLLITTL
ncbi:hypothetical protein [Prevotella histicola]|nr:hypothetical protein [Prevotella histicola]